MVQDIVSISLICFCLVKCLIKLDVKSAQSLQKSELSINKFNIGKLLYPLQTKFGGGGYVGISLSVCPSVQSKLNLDHNFYTKGDRALILHKCIPCDKTFLWIPKFFTL